MRTKGSLWKSNALAKINYLLLWTKWLIIQIQTYSQLRKNCFDIYALYYKFTCIFVGVPPEPDHYFQVQSSSYLICRFYSVIFLWRADLLPWYSNLNPGLFCEWSLWKYTVVSWEVVRRDDGMSCPPNRPITALVSRGPLRISRKSWLASVEKLRNCMWAPDDIRKTLIVFNNLNNCCHIPTHMSYIV